MADTEAMMGFGIFEKTEFGKAFATLAPAGCTRIIIDIPCDDLVKIYYETVNSKKVLNLNWGEVAAEIEAVSSDELIARNKKAPRRLSGIAR